MNCSLIRLLTHRYLVVLEKPTEKLRLLKFELCNAAIIISVKNLRCGMRLLADLLVRRPGFMTWKCSVKVPTRSHLASLVLSELQVDFAKMDHCLLLEKIGGGKGGISKISVTKLDLGGKSHCMWTPRCVTDLLPVMATPSHITVTGQTDSILTVTYQSLCS